MSTTKWAHLPNAAHIDRVLASIKLHRMTAWCEANQGWTEARDSAGRVARNIITDMKRDDVWKAIWNSLSCVWDGCYNVLICLTAYDDSAHMLDFEVGELKILAAFGDQKAILLLPACIALHAIKNKS